MRSIQVKVAQVLDEFTVVLNKGRDDDINIDDKFLIFGFGPEIKDPDTGENLGNIELVRGQVKVTHLQDRICTARSILFERVPSSKRTVEGGLRYATFGERKEVYEYPATTEEKALDHPQSGDFARPI